MNKLDALKTELTVWGRYCMRSESALAGGVKSPSAKIEEIGRVGIFAHGTGHLDQRADNQIIPGWVELIDAKVNCLPPKMRTIIRAEYAKRGDIAQRARSVGVSPQAFKRLLSMALIQLLSY